MRKTGEAQAGEKCVGGEIPSWFYTSFIILRLIAAYRILSQPYIRDSLDEFRLFSQVFVIFVFPLILEFLTVAIMLPMVFHTETK